MIQSVRCDSFIFWTLYEQFNRCEESIMKKKYWVFIKYIIWSWFFAWLDILLLYIFKEYVWIDTLIASAFSFTIALVLWFLYQKYYTFSDKKSAILQTFMRFAIYQISSYIIYVFILWVWTSKLNIYYIFVAWFGKVVSFFYNFLMNRYFNFSFKWWK